MNNKSAHNMHKKGKTYFFTMILKRNDGNLYKWEYIQNGYVFTNKHKSYTY